MAKNRKVILIVLCSVLLVVVAAFALLVAVDFDYSNIGGEQAKKKQVYCEKNHYTGLEIEEVAGDVNIILSQQDNYRVEGYEKGGIYTFVDRAGEDAPLRVSVVDNRKWYEKVFVDTSDMVVNVYLPYNGFDNIKIKTVSGDVNLMGGFSTNIVKISTVSGDVICGSVGSEATNIATTSGDIEVSGKAGGEINVTSTSGEIKLDDVGATNMSVNSTSGNVVCGLAIVSSKAEVKTVSGNVKFSFISASKLEVKTTSGNIVGALESGKTINANTVSGKIILPEKAVVGADAKFTTTSGNIKITEFGK